jgi:hypothetical protein
MGINSYQQGQNGVINGSDIGVGFRLGVLLGGRVGEMFSVNGEITIDVINPRNVPTGVDISAADVVLAFSPLVHVPAGNIEIVAGPKLGFWGLSADSTFQGLTDNFSASGYVLGLNAGIFGTVGSGLSVGGLIALDVRTPQKECSTPAGGFETCQTVLDDANKVLGISGALLF